MRASRSGAEGVRDRRRLRFTGVLRCVKLVWLCVADLDAVGGAADASHFFGAARAVRRASSRERVASRLEGRGRS